MEWKYSEDKKHIVLDKEPTQKLRITGHRLATVLGIDKWSTPFKAWCEITKLVKAPFEETKYTLFGKAVEPKLINYISNQYPNVMSIEEYYGNIFDDYRFNNFKDDSNVFGGVIDAVSVRNDMKTIAAIIECKTSSHPEQWDNNQVPVEYLLQGALYSYLKGLDRIVFIVTFPEEIDYANPENYKLTEENTKVIIQRLADILIPVDNQYLNIEECMEYARKWWDEYIVNGISPEFDEKEDKEYLDIIRASKPCEDNELIDVCEQAIQLTKDIKELETTSGLKDMQDRLKKMEANIKDVMIEQELTESGKYKLTRKTKVKFNEKAFEKEQPELYSKYADEEISYTLSKSLKEEEE